MISRRCLLSVALIVCSTIFCNDALLLTSAAEPTGEKIKVHVVAHTHDDIGWLETIDQYYYTHVQWILDGVVDSLAADPNRKFTYVEQGFFSRWWNEQDGLKRAVTRALVKNEQLKFILGGWCMNDEATVHYQSVIDQHTFGHRFLTEEFGVIPRIGWQIDPFGHSSTQASLFASFGFDAMFFARLDHADSELRAKEKNFETLWQGSRSLGKSNEIFTKHLHAGYGWPSGLNFEDSSINVNDDINLYEYNVQQMVDIFVKRAQEYVNVTRHNHVFYPMGMDFNYVNAQRNFKNMDKLIKYVNEDGRVEAFYSTPEQYIDMINELDVEYSTKTDDFFPYSDGEHAYWTGYFTSRPLFKRLERYAMGYLAMCRQVEAALGQGKHEDYNSDHLAEPMGIAQHHDSVSGTAKQFVNDDYTKRINVGIGKCDKVVHKYMQERFGLQETDACHYQTLNIHEKFNVAEERIDQGFKEYCNPLDNNDSDSFVLSVYNPLGFMTRNGDGKSCRQETIRIPYKYQYAKVIDLTVGEDDNNNVTTVYVPVAISKHASSLFLKEDSDENVPFEYQLSFEVCVAPTDAKVFRVMKTDSIEFNKIYNNNRDDSDNKGMIQNDANEDVYTLENGNGLEVKVSKTTGMIVEVVNGNCSIKVKQEFGYYISSTDKKQSSGAYIFRPLKQSYDIISGTEVFINKTDSVTIHVKLNEWTSQSIRIGDTYVEVKVTVGPLPIDDNNGKEVVVSYLTDIRSGNRFYTDANGREMQQRIKDHRNTWTLNTTWEPVSQNYYPVNTRILIKDEDEKGTNHRAFALITDRSCGGSSLNQGGIEIMVHRRCLADDARGVNEALNETDALNSNKGIIVTASHYLDLSCKSSNINNNDIDNSDVGSYSSSSRSLAHEITYPLRVFYHKDQESIVANTNGLGSLMSNNNNNMNDINSLNKQLHLLTFEVVGENEYLVRLDNFYELDDGGDVVIVDMYHMFNKKTFGKVVSIHELGLSANQLKSNINRLRWTSKDDKEKEDKDGSNIKRRAVTLKNKKHFGKNVDINVETGRTNGHSIDVNIDNEYEILIDDISRNMNILVTIKPQQIRTFKIIFQK